MPPGAREGSFGNRMLHGPLGTKSNDYDGDSG